MSAVSADLRFRESLHTEITGEQRPCLDVFAGDRYLGQVMEVHHTITEDGRITWEADRWWAKPAGAPWFRPNDLGTQEAAIADLERSATRTTGYRITGIPEELVISQLRKEQARTERREQADGPTDR